MPPGQHCSVLVKQAKTHCNPSVPSHTRLTWPHQNSFTPLSDSTERSQKHFEPERVEQAQPEQAAAEETGMPDLTAGQQTAFRDGGGDTEVRAPVSAGAITVDRAANTTAVDKAAAASATASKGDAAVIRCCSGCTGGRSAGPAGSSGCVEAAQNVPESPSV